MKRLFILSLYHGCVFFDRIPIIRHWNRNHPLTRLSGYFDDKWETGVWIGEEAEWELNSFLRTDQSSR